MEFTVITMYHQSLLSFKVTSVADNIYRADLIRQTGNEKLPSSITITKEKTVWQGDAASESLTQKLSQHIEKMKQEELYS